ncbi:hypothetical protein [Mesorhizobium sp. YM1C-6-2]|uniref:hypothetical protein n=1 Tax=Mesorhizobium sp. YM1C-6-2 TaxID=1827501 RepID=UPI000EF1B3CD|nr:hypothetical protein [Mesorhizobium sp. YM1C-6-2]RLP21991.1 hypothetical protein D8676_26370 [Mesorhizobium sp. YM1C-6-2]
MARLPARDHFDERTNAVNDNRPPLVVDNNGVDRRGTRGSRLVRLLLAVLLLAAVGAVLVMMSV